jgi:hypothetical protein
LRSALGSSSVGSIATCLQFVCNVKKTPHIEL